MLLKFFAQPNCFINEIKLLLLLPNSQKKNITEPPMTKNSWKVGSIFHLSTFRPLEPGAELRVSDRRAHLPE